MTTIIFLVSLFALFFLLASKAFEIKVRKVSFISSLWSKGDKVIDHVIDWSVFKYNRYKKISHIFIFEFLPSYLYEVLVKTKDHVSKRYYSSADGFRGRRVLRSNGSVSFFLERLGEDKSQPDVRKV